MNYVMVTGLSTAEFMLLVEVKAEKPPALNVVEQASVPIVMAQDLFTAVPVVVQEIKANRVPKNT